MVIWKVWHDCCMNQNQDAQKPNRGAPNPFIHMLLDLPSLISLSHSLWVWPSLIPNRSISPSPTMIRAPLFFRENRPFPSLSPVVCSATLLRSRNTTVNTLLSLLFIFTVSICVCVCVWCPYRHCTVQHETQTHGGINKYVGKKHTKPPAFKICSHWLKYLEIIQVT